ncbi:NAD(P)/FAD-dependent oxidoreductase [Lysinibacillus sp. NPDC093688]|uniref:NAD(P)/FAD-dependent oxidoreductase n=1 Tax=Lysinibacillus sp. NPDC093688 TaxID=3390577 RepID=UPI003D07D425
MSENLLTMLALDIEKETIEDVHRTKQEINALEQYLNEARSLSEKKSVLIIGGGIIGLLTAYFLQEIGFEVSIVEAKSFAAAASGRNGGAIMTLGRELSEMPYSLNALKIWSQLSEKGIETHFKKNGHLMVARNDIEANILRKSYELYVQAGIHVELLDNKSMKKYVPFLSDDIPLGIYSHDDGSAYPFTTSQSLIKSLKQGGAKLYNHCYVEKIVTEKNKILAVQTPKGSFTADYFIISTGPWTQKICKELSEHIPIRPRRSQLFATEIVRQNIIKPFFTGNGIYLRQTHAGNILFGGGGPWELDGYELNNTIQAIQLQSGRFLELFPKLKNKKLLRTFAGTVELTPDFTPIMGKLMTLENGFVSAGYNGHGFGISTVMGKLMSSYLYDYIHHTELDDVIKDMLKKLSVDRFEKVKETGD